VPPWPQHRTATVLHRCGRCRRLQIFAVDVAGHVHDLLCGGALDLAVEPGLIEVKFPGHRRYELLTLRTEHVVKLGALSTRERSQHSHCNGIFLFLKTDNIHKLFIIVVAVAVLLLLLLLLLLLSLLIVVVVIIINNSRPYSSIIIKDRFLKKEVWEPNSAGSRICADSPEKNFRFWISDRRILVQTGCFLYSSPKAGLNAVSTVKITLGVPAGNDP